MKEIDKKSASELLADNKVAPTKIKTLQEQIDFELAQATCLIDEGVNEETEAVLEDQNLETSEFMELTKEESQEILSNLAKASKESDEVIENVHELASMIEQTLDSIDQEDVEVEHAFVEETANIYSLQTKTKFVPEEPTNSASNSIQLQMIGQTELKLLIGQHETKINLNNATGIELVVGDISITINENLGCHIESKNGINLTIPLSIDVLEHKKKAA